MCGISGIISSSEDPGIRRIRVERMLDKIAHRGPDDEGLWESAQLCLGHRRLSILDLSPLGHQPMVLSSPKTAIVYNGEIFNYKELKADLEKSGLRFKSQSDTEVLLQAYRAWGRECLNRIKGFFAFAIWGEEKRELFCARDPFGKKPFYYSAAGDSFVFSSEIGSLTEAFPSKPGLNDENLPYYLWKGYFLPGRTAYEGICSLKPGHFLVFSPDRGVVRESPYRELKFSLGIRPSVSREALLEEGLHRIETAVKRRLQSDVPIGVLLSGGVDSSFVALTALRQKTSQALSVFTASFEEKGFDESRYAQHVARRGKIEPTLTRVRMGDVPSLLPRLIQAYGEPFGDDSSIPAYCLFESLKSHVKVALTGDGGDETLAGYADVKPFLLAQKFAFAKKLNRLVPQSGVNRLLASRNRTARLAGYLLRTLDPEGGRLFHSLIRAGWDSQWMKRFFRPEAYRRLAPEAVESEDLARFRAAGQNDLERYLNRNLERLSQAFLVKIDRASMAHSIEARSPLLDIDLFDWASRLTAGELLRGSEPKSILKDLLDREMGCPFSRRPKMGFSPPLSGWLQTEPAARWAEESLTRKDSLAHSLISPEKSRELIQAHARGMDHTGRLWKLIFLNEWHRASYTV